MTIAIVQESLDLFDHSTPIQAPTRLTFKPTPDDDVFVEDEYDFGRQITAYELLPKPQEWVDRFMHSAIEILNGRRAAVQLSRWCNRKVFTYLSENARVRPAVVRIGRKRISQPFPQILEVTVMLHGSERSRVLVARFEGLDGRWICVELYTI
jgi:hypothetical protein